jgi:mono/diheme cytochrome c family protein
MAEPGTKMQKIIMTHKNLAAALRLAVIAGLGVATAVLAADLTKLPPPSQQKDVTFDKDIGPIFKANCVECHGATRPKHNLRLDSLEATLKGGSDGPVIVPGKSDQGDLIQAVCWETKPDHPMPPNPAPRRGAPAGATNTPPPPPPGGPAPAARKELTPAQIGLIRAWIDQGAK